MLVKLLKCCSRGWVDAKCCLSDILGSGSKGFVSDIVQIPDIMLLEQTERRHPKMLSCFEVDENIVGSTYM